MAFDLRQNPFAVLEVSPRATRAEVNDAFRDRQLDMETPEQERRLDLARQALFTPRERLAAELSWLLELPASHTQGLLAWLDGRQKGQVPANIDGLAAANLAAHCCDGTAKAGRPIWPAPAMDLVQAYRNLDVSALANELATIRHASGFGVISPTELQTGLGKLRVDHVAVLMTGRAEEAAPSLFELTRGRKDESETARRFVNDLFDAYARHVTKPLEALSAKIEALLADVEQGQAATTRLHEFKELLAEWQGLVLPLQERDHSQGLEESSSRTLLERIRLATLVLNKADRNKDALTISKAALEAGGRLPRLAEALQADNAILEGNVRHDEMSRRLTNVRGALAQARSACAKLGSSNSPPDGFDALFAVVKALISTDPDRNVIDLALTEVRQFAIELHNEHSNVDAAIVVAKRLDLLASAGSPDMRARIATDLDHLWRTKSWTMLGKALKASRWSDAARLCDELIEKAKGEEYDNLAQLRRTIEGKRKAWRTKAAIWAAVIGVPVTIGMMNDSHGSSTPATAYESVEAPPETYDQTEAAPQAVVDTVPEPVMDDGSETMPEPGGGERRLSRQELRYCMSQAKRIDGAREAVSSYGQQTAFNALVNDFNSRCGNFLYDHPDMDAVNGELLTRSYTLQQEGRTLVQQNAGTAVNPLSLPPSLGTGYGAAGGGQTYDGQAPDTDQGYAGSGTDYQGGGY